MLYKICKQKYDKLHKIKKNNFFTTNESVFIKMFLQISGLVS